MGQREQVPAILASGMWNTLRVVGPQIQQGLPEVHGNEQVSTPASSPTSFSLLLAFSSSCCTWLLLKKQCEHMTSLHKSLHPPPAAFRVRPRTLSTAQSLQLLPPTCTCPLLLFLHPSISDPFRSLQPAIGFPLLAAWVPAATSSLDICTSSSSILASPDFSFPSTLLNSY